MPKYLIENKFHCNYCNYKTNIQTNYINHQSRKHNINTTFFACELCLIYRGKTKGDLVVEADRGGTWPAFPRAASLHVRGTERELLRVSGLECGRTRA